ncbi:MAG: cytochrome c biogenesis protein ResB [Chloroflexi bacterium]|nr:cytochrome c biogenesis protein ResB [Chloroflexota bacterium]
MSTFFVVVRGVSARRSRALPRWLGLREHRLALVLLGAFAAVLLLGAIVPQRWTLPPIEYGRWRQTYAPVSSWLEALGFTNAAPAPALAAVAVPLMASLAHCTARRLLALGRQWAASGVTRASLGRLGSAVFHGSLLVGLVAYTASGAARFSGHAELSPGQSVLDLPDRYMATEVGWLPLPASGLTIRLDGLLLDAWADGSLKEQAALISVLRDGRLLAQRELERSQPIDVEGLTIVLASQTGPAVLLALMDERGGRGGWVHFPAWPGEGRTDLTFQVPQTPLLLAVTLEGATLQQRDAAVLTLRPLGENRSDGGRRGGSRTAPTAADVGAVREPPNGAGEWRLRPGEEAAIGPYQFRFVAVDSWNGVTINRDPFVGWAFGAFAVGLAGLALVTLLPGGKGTGSWSSSK